MHEAALNGRLDVCRLIMDQVAEKNPANMFRETPLHIAATYGRLELCRTIMEAFCRNQEKVTNDPVIINALMFVCKTMHDSLK